MKNIKYITFFMPVVLLVFGCKKLLKENNPGGFTAETVYSTPAGFESLVRYAYSYSRCWYGKEQGYAMSEGGTDLWTNGNQYQANNSLCAPFLMGRSVQTLDATNGSLSFEWQKLYAAVNLINEGLAMVDKSGLTDNLKKTREGELRFLRAFYNWHIVETWGGVYLSKEPTSVAATEVKPSSVEDFYSLIFEDLQFASQNLPIDQEYGRANKFVAKAFLARMYLTRKMYPEAKAEALDVINSGKYTLLPKYSDLWDMKKLVNSEVIWVVNYSSKISDQQVPDVYNDGYNLTGKGSERGDNNGHLIFTHQYENIFSFPILTNIYFAKVGKTVPAIAKTQWPLQRDVRYGRGFNRMFPTKFLLDLYDGTKDSRYKGSFQTVWICNQTVTKGPFIGLTAYRDTAMVVDKNPTTTSKYFSWNVYDTYNEDGTSKKFEDNVICPNLIKFLDSTRNATGTTASEIGAGKVQSARDVFVLRLAEMHLIVAEASVGLGDQGTAKDHLNKIRRRAELHKGSGELDVTADIDIDFILDERAREFAGEQIRWFDLKRTGKLVERVKRGNPDAASFIQPYHNLRPIPLSQLNAVTNKSEFLQNNGY